MVQFYCFSLFLLKSLKLSVVILADSFEVFKRKAESELCLSDRLEDYEVYKAEVSKAEDSFTLDALVKEIQRLTAENDAKAKDALVKEIQRLNAENDAKAKEIERLNNLVLNLTADKDAKD